MSRNRFFKNIKQTFESKLGCKDCAVFRRNRNNSPTKSQVRVEYFVGLSLKSVQEKECQKKVLSAQVLNTPFIRHSSSDSRYFIPYFFRIFSIGFSMERAHAM